MSCVDRWAALGAATLMLGASSQVTAQAADPEPPATTIAPATPAPAEEAPSVEAAPAAPAPAAPAPVAAPVAAPIAAEISLNVSASDVSASVDGPGEEAEDSAEEEIIVTGSRIKRNSFDTPTPVQVINREQIAKSGASNMADLIRVLTANSGSEGQAGLGQGSTGAAQFNLRGLGLANTLVLVNGRRLTPYPDSFGVANSASFSDVNQIPLQFVERIEIAKGGASAIYGSDAIAGVVNIILRKNFDGFQISATGFTTGALDQQDGEVSAIFGAESEKSSLVAQFNYFARTPLRAVDRDFTEGTMFSNVGNPGTFIVANPPIPAMPDANPPTLEMPQAASYIPDTGCGAEGTDSFLNETGSLCRFDFRKDWNLYNKQQRILAYVTAEHRVSDAFQLFGEFGYSRKRTDVSSSPSYPLVRSITVPGDHVDSPANFTGRSATWLGRPFGRKEGSAITSIQLNGFRAVGGINGELDELGLRDWSWDVSLTWHANEHTRSNEDVLFDKFQTAVNSCSDASDLSECFTPFANGSAGANSAQVFNKINGQFKVVNSTELLVGDASLSGPIVELPGGDMAVAVGAQIRRLTQNVDYDHDAEDGAYAFVLGGNDWGGVQNVIAGFAELSLPFIKGGELQGAIRAEHYKDLQTSVNPRVALSWTPSGVLELPAVLEKFRMRGSVGTAFRAPNLIQTRASLTNLEQFGRVFRAVNTVANSNLKPETSVAFSAGFEWIYEGLNLDFDFWQYKVSDLIVRQNAQSLELACRAQATANMVPITEAPGCEGLFTALPGDPNAWQSMTLSYKNQDQITTNGIDMGVKYALDLDSAGKVNVGIGGTYVLSYTVPADTVRKLTIAADPENPVAQDGCDGDTCDIAGKRNRNNPGRSMPRLRMRIPLSWSIGGHVANFALNYISGYDDDANDDGEGNLDAISAWATLDVSYGYILGETVAGSATQIRVGVNNLLGTDPPYVKGINLGYDIFTHDPRGQILYANLTHTF